MQSFVFVFFICFVLALFSLIMATKALQKNKNKLIHALEDKNLKPVASFVLKNSLSFFFSYKIFILFIYFFLSKKHIEYDKENSIEIAELMDILLLINVRAFWYNYIIVLILSVIPIVFALMMNKLENIVRETQKAIFKDFSLVK